MLHQVILLVTLVFTGFNSVTLTAVSFSWDDTKLAPPHNWFSDPLQ
jgi:hypothetical protein